jgi:hypothetical protein
LLTRRYRIEPNVDAPSFAFFSPQAEKGFTAVYLCFVADLATKQTAVFSKFLAKRLTARSPCVRG